MSNEEKEFIKKVNVDKAKKKTIVSIVFMGLSLLTYAIPFMVGMFDFGIFFEIVSLVFLLMARNYMAKYNQNGAKMCIICSMVSIGAILIYDIILLCSVIQNAVDLVFVSYYYWFRETFSISYLMILLAIHRDLSKANNPIKYKESTDWFYEKGQNKNGMK